MKNSTPLVSVIVLTYNQEHTIARTLESILAQKTNFPFEIIIGEDASPSDNTRAVCEAYVAKYPGIIRLMPKAPNKGLLRNYRDCTKECHGKYIATCAGDDWWSNELKMQQQIDFLENNPDYGLCYGGAICHNLTNGITIYQPPQKPDNINLLNQLLKNNFIVAPTVLYRRSLLENINFEEFSKLEFKMEDYPMWINISLKTKFHAIDKPLVTYVINDNSLSHSESIDKQLIFENTVLRIKLYYWAKFNSSLPVETITNTHFILLFYSLLKTGKYRTQAKYFLKQASQKTISQRIAYIASSCEPLYKIIGWCYNKKA